MARDAPFGFYYWGVAMGEAVRFARHNIEFLGAIATRFWGSKNEEEFSAFAFVTGVLMSVALLGAVGAFFKLVAKVMS